MKHCIAIFFLFCFYICSAENTEAKKLLIISSYGSDYQWSNSIIDEINVQLKKTHPGLELNVEYLSTERFKETSLWINRLNLIISNYKKRHPVGIILISDEAWMAYRAANTEEFKDIPLFLCGIKPHTISIEKYKENYFDMKLDQFSLTTDVMREYNATGVLRETNINGSIKLMLQTIPKLDQFTLITDNRLYGIYTRLLFEKYVQLMHPKLNTQFIDARFVNTDSLLMSLHKIKPTTGVLLTSWLTGGNGFTYSKDYVYNQMASRLHTPIFITDDIGIEKNYFLGGFFNEASFWGNKVAQMAVAVLNGGSPKKIEPETYKDSECYFNWTVFHNFGLSSDKITTHITYVNKPVPLFVKYRHQIISACAFFLLILLIFINILRSHSKLKKAQKLTLELMEKTEMANIELNATKENLVMALENAEQADRLKSAFIANMGHEIRTPLNAILGFSNIITSMESQEDRDEIAKQIEQNSDALLRLIDSILDLSQLEARSIKFNFEEVSADGLCIDLVNARRTLCNKDVSLLFVVPDHALMLITDPQRLSQVISIMIDNAIKFTFKGKIELGYFSYDDEYVEFFVQDTGIGIPAEKLDIVFERFVKLDYYVTGVGLGLTVAKSIVEMFGGQIGVSSEVGVGSRFWFRIKKNLAEKN